MRKARQRGAADDAGTRTDLDGRLASAIRGGTPRRSAQSAPQRVPARRRRLRRRPRRHAPHAGHGCSRTRGRRAIAAGGVAVLLIAAGAGAGVLVDDGGGGTTPLPATSDPVVKARQGQTRAGAVYASASPAVVSLRAGNATGTGFLIDREGRVVTNAHVVEGNDRVEVRFGADSDSIEGQVRGTDPSSDLAVVEIDPGKVPGGVTAVAPGRLPRRAGRRRGDRDRQPLRPRSHRHGGHRLRSRARDPGSERLLDRLRDPDRCTDQPGELGRAPARPERACDRRQLPDRNRRVSGQCRNRLCSAVQHRARRWCRP